MILGQGIIDENALNIFTDGSSFPLKKRAAGVGVCLVWVNENGDEEFEEYAPPGWISATIDEVEILACVEGLREAKRLFPNLVKFKRILIFSDSNYVVENFFRAMNIWPRRKWIGSNSVPVDNIDLWKQFRKEVNSCKLRVDVEWVKGHKKNRYNKIADSLAKKSANIPVRKPLKISDTTRKWSDRKTKRGCVTLNGQKTKIRIISRENVKAAKTYEYRYEIIDCNDLNFKAVDFVRFEEYISRNKCLYVEFNDIQNAPQILKILEILDCSEYKY